MTAEIDWYYDSLPGATFARALHELRERGPVVSVRALAGALPVYYVIGYEALARAFRDAERFPPGLAYQVISKPFIGNTFMSMDEAEHRIWRPPMTPRFRKGAIDELDDRELAPLAHELIDRIEARGQADLARTFTRLFPFAVICRQLGLARENEHEFYHWSMDLMFGGRDLAASRRADAKLSAAVSPVIAARRRDSSFEDVIGEWSRTEVAGRPVTDEEILAHVRLFFTAGATTTSDALGNLVHALLTHPRAWEACVADPGRAGEVVEEGLRWNPPVAAQPRFSRASEEIEFEGVRIPARSAVLFGIAAANRDPEVFEDPDRFDLSRRPKELLTFGPGHRTCPGMHFARRNLCVALEALTQRLPKLRLCDREGSEPRGILLRGPVTLPVAWS